MSSLGEIQCLVRLGQQLLAHAHPECCPKKPLPSDPEVSESTRSRSRPSAALKQMFMGITAHKSARDFPGHSRCGTSFAGSDRGPLGYEPNGKSLSTAESTRLTSSVKQAALKAGIPRFGTAIVHGLTPREPRLPYDRSSCGIRIFARRSTCTGTLVTDEMAEANSKVARMALSRTN